MPVKASKEIIETICEGGLGGEAEVLVQARNVFPGIGGTIATDQIAAVAWRKDFNAFSTIGDSMFLKHLIIKKLDDYFCRIGKYTYPHIARPLGSTALDRGDQETGYFYEWVYGSEAFPWIESVGHGENQNIILDEWPVFIGAFDGAGISVGHDAADSDNANISQNIIHQLCHIKDGKLNRFWKRIDFGSRSLPIDDKKLQNFLENEKQELIRILGENRYELLVYALHGLRVGVWQGSVMTGNDRRKLEALVSDYRMSTLRHHRPNLAIQ